MTTWATETTTMGIGETIITTITQDVAEITPTTTTEGMTTITRGITTTSNRIAHMAGWYRMTEDQSQDH